MCLVPDEPGPEFPRQAVHFQVLNNSRCPESRPYIRKIRMKSYIALFRVHLYVFDNAEGTTACAEFSITEVGPQGGPPYR